MTRIFAGAGASSSPRGIPTKGGIFRRDTSGGTWEALNNGLPPNLEVHAVLIDPANTNTVYAGTNDGPYRSRDGGDHWQKLDFPDKNAMIWTIAIHPTRPNTLYAGTAPIALYRSLDGGDSWVRLPNAVSPGHCERAGFDSRVLRISFDPNRPDDVYAALEVSGIIRSTDNGETWTDMSAPLIKLADLPHLRSNVGGRHCGHCEGMLDSHASAISSAAPDTVFLGLRMGLFRSDDRGVNWYDTEIGRFSPITYCHDVIVSSHNPRVLYTCLSPAAVSDDGALYRSDDLATTWRRIDHGVKMGSTLMAVAEDPADAARICCVTRKGQVFGTEDAGASWREYRLPEGVEDVYAIACA